MIRFGNFGKMTVLAAVALMALGGLGVQARDTAPSPVQIKAAAYLVTPDVYITAQNTVVVGEFAARQKGFNAKITGESVAPDGKSATVVFQGPSGKSGVITLTQTAPQQGTIAAVVDYGDGTHYALAPIPASWVNIKP